MASPTSSGVIEFHEAEIGFRGMAEGWEACLSVRSRFRKALTWLQWPIQNRPTDVKPEDEPNPDEANGVLKPRNPHGASTRALELNFEILDSMLNQYEGEFIDIERITKEAGFQLGRLHALWLFGTLVHETCQVKRLFRMVKHVPEDPSQAAFDAWDLRQLWTYLWKRSKDSVDRGQQPRDSSALGGLVFPLEDWFCSVFSIKIMPGPQPSCIVCSCVPGAATVGDSTWASG